MTQEHEKYLQKAEAEVLSQKGFAELLLASSEREMAYIAELRQAYEQIDELSKGQSITNITNNFNGPVAQAISSTDQATLCQASTLPTTSMPRLGNTSTM